jgi:polyphosphate kinase
MSAKKNGIYQNREVSTLSFNDRVLQEAEDKRNPLLERLRFLGIFSSNMDEFFKVRVASAHRRLEIGEKRMSAVLDHVSQKALGLDERFQHAYANIIRALSRYGIELLTEKDIVNHKQRDWILAYFRSEVLPSLVPLIISEDEIFPHLRDGSLYFGVKMSGEENTYAILEIPSALPRFLELPNGSIMYIDDVIRFALGEVFYIFEYDEIEAYEFKISRDAELDMDNDFSEGYVHKMERVLKQRRGGRPTRFVYDATMPDDLLDLLQGHLDIGEDDAVIDGGRYHNMKDLMHFPIHRRDLSFEEMPPAPHPRLKAERVPLHDVIAKRDVLVTYPYQSFDYVLRLLREAAIDPRVSSIKMTLYRSAQNSQVVNALINAARNGKEVLVSVELQARFDEKNNIKIANLLTEAGATVGYGIPPMKVHSKLLLIRRDDVTIAGLSTGNFNETTARTYVDSTLLTADPRLTEEVEQVFLLISQTWRIGAVKGMKFEHLLVSPLNTRRRLLQHIADEREKGKSGYILFKVNHLTDSGIVKALLKAADAGVKMDLIVRTTYGLQPHKNIRSISILDRFLEHQRVLIFGRGEEQHIFLSSADLMERNIDWRVEVAFPVYDKQLRQQLCQMMEFQVGDTYKGRLLNGKQSNDYLQPRWKRYRAQYRTYRYFKSLYAKSQRSRNGRAGSAMQQRGRPRTSRVP